MTATRFDTSPEEALRALQSHSGPVLVDLDETLYLRSSTEDFIGSAWPKPLAFLLMKMLDLVRPWRFSGGAQTRDVWRVAAILVLMPWTILSWHRAVKRFGVEAGNRRLLATLDACGHSPIVVTLGFRPIVVPLLAAMGLKDAQLVAMSPWRFRDRRQGKRVMVAKAIGDQQIREAMLITDSTDDLELLDCCLRPLRVVWPEATWRDAFHDLYVPGIYITRVKRPGQRYIYRGIISDEYSTWVLATLALATQPVLHVVGLALLSISFWAIYESGYVDNDRIGARYEKNPGLTRQFFEGGTYSPTVLPWCWAIGCGIAALLLLRYPESPDANDLLAWAAVLVLTCLWFRLYNRMDKQTRIWLFAGLQSLRALSIVAVVSMTLVGLVALLAHVLARWVPYYNYRLTKGEYNDGHLGRTRLLFFVIMSAALGLAEGFEPFFSPTGFALLVWFVWKARRELVQSCRNAHLITRTSPRKANLPTGPSGAQRRSK